MFAKEVGKQYGDTNHALLVKIVISPNMAIAQYPMLHNIGLAKDTLDGFQRRWVCFAANELLLMLGAAKLKDCIIEENQNVLRL